MVCSHRRSIPRALREFIPTTTSKWGLLNTKRGLFNPYYYLGTPLTAITALLGGYTFKLFDELNNEPLSSGTILAVLDTLEILFVKGNCQPFVTCIFFVIW